MIAEMIPGLWEVYVGKMISMGGHSRPPRDHFKNDFKGGVQPPECWGDR